MLLRNVDDDLQPSKLVPYSFRYPLLKLFDSHLIDNRSHAIHQKTPKTVSAEMKLYSPQSAEFNIWLTLGIPVHGTNSCGENTAIPSGFLIHSNGSRGSTTTILIFSKQVVNLAFLRIFFNPQVCEMVAHGGVEGECEERFALVRTILEENLAHFGDRGASVCVRVGGRIVVDLRAGEQKEGQPWQEDTLVNVYSCTKAMTSLAVLLLIDRGHLDWSTRVGALWPAFACEGKDTLTVEHLLTHQSGLLTLDGVQLSTDDLQQWTRYLHSTAHAAQPHAPSFWLVDHLAQLRPHWPAASGLFGYHPLTAGLFLSELVRRADPHHRRWVPSWLKLYESR